MAWLAMEYNQHRPGPAAASHQLHRSADLRRARLSSANWAGATVMTVPPLALIMWRIRIEEKALPATLGGYQVYAEPRKRIIPFIW